MHHLEVVTIKDTAVRITTESLEKLQFESYPFRFLANNEVVAEGELKYDREDGYLEIKMIEVIRKREGFGKAFIHYLKDIPGITVIWGEAVPESVSFWDKVGAQFYDADYIKYLDTSEIETEEIQPLEFYINVQNQIQV